MNDETTTSTAAQDPAAIEADIRRTQEQMSRTVDRIGDQLTPRNLMNALLDKAESNDIDARYLLDGARRNPLALAMISGGLIWLISDNDAKLPSLGKNGKESPSSDRESRMGEDFGDRYHRDYIAHMERFQRSEDEDDFAYQRRRDLHRANYFMLERGHDEEEGAFRQRLDQITERFRQKRHDWAESARNTGNAAGDVASNASAATRQVARQTAEQARNAYVRNPLIGGLLAAVAGAIAGTAIPLTQMEDQKLSDLGETARDTFDEQKDRLVSAAREKKDQLIEKVEQAGDASRAPSQEPQAQPSGANDSSIEPVHQLAAHEPTAPSSGNASLPTNNNQQG